MTQTYITTFEDGAGRIIDFHRWSYKRLDTCINALAKLYMQIVKRGSEASDLAKAVQVVTYKTDYKVAPDCIVSVIDMPTFWTLLDSQYEMNSK